MKKTTHTFLVCLLALTSLAAMAQVQPKPVKPLKTKPAVQRKAHKANWFARMFTLPHRHSKKLAK